jgi:hypothetical protein
MLRFKISNVLWLMAVMAITVAWGVLAQKVITETSPNPAYPHGRGIELVVLGLVLAGLTAAVAIWSLKSTSNT